ncbi:hypothetical protein BRD00_08090 [Halobacteriales archaeon QS_8_69_26]|nr:MAG: hypothetical protein BRD00_08090 [Halobacteriales archaeon QS_8_69_26]
MLRRIAGVAGLGGVAGCVAPTTNDPPVRERSVAELGLPPDVCEEDVSGDPGIYAVVDPAFEGDWSGLAIPDRYDALTDDVGVVGLERDGRARAYPLPVLWHHEIVNDDFGGPTMVTYCPLCRSGVVADRRVAGRTRDFLVSGLLWTPPRLQTRIREDDGTVFGADRSGEAEVRNQGNLVTYDRDTRSYWSQLLAEAICGPLQGAELRIRPSTVATWGEWRADHPDTEVLLPPPHSGTVAPR